MTKYYISDTEHKLLIERDNKDEALNAYAKYWLAKGVQLHPVLSIDGHGFAEPSVADDTTDTLNVLRRIKI